MIIKTLRNEEEKKLREYLQHVKKAVRMAQHPKKQQKKPGNYKFTDECRIVTIEDIFRAILRKDFGRTKPEMFK